MRSRSQKPPNPKANKCGAPSTFLPRLYKYLIDRDTGIDVCKGGNAIFINKKMLRRYLHSELRDKNIIDKNTSAGMKASIIEKSYGACLRNCQLYFRAIEKCDLECCITSNNKKASGFLTYATREGHSPHNRNAFLLSPRIVSSDKKGSKRKISTRFDEAKNTKSEDGASNNASDRQTQEVDEEAAVTEEEVEKTLEEPPQVQKRRKKGRPRNLSRERERLERESLAKEQESQQLTTKTEDLGDERAARRDRRASQIIVSKPRKKAAAKPAQLPKRVEVSEDSSKIIIRNPFKKQDENSDTNTTQPLSQPSSAPPTTAITPPETQKAKEAKDRELTLLYEQIELLKQVRQAQEARQLNQLQNMQIESEKQALRKSSLLVKLDIKRIKSKPATPTHAPAPPIKGAAVKNQKSSPAPKSTISSPLSAPPSLSSLPLLSASSSGVSTDKYMSSAEFHDDAAAFPSLNSPNSSRLSPSPQPSEVEPIKSYESRQSRILCIDTK